MAGNRREFLKSLAAGAAAGYLGGRGMRAGSLVAGSPTLARRIPIALVQFDAVPGQVERNLDYMERLAAKAADAGAHWIQFHELTTCDYVQTPAALAEPVPQGSSTARMSRLAQRLGVMMVFGLAEKDGERIYDTAVFVGPQGYIYHYRKTWLWHVPGDEGYRDEWVRFDPGTGPDLFHVEDARATCFICADSNSRRCVERAAALKPQVVFFPINRHKVSSFQEYGAIAKRIGAPMLVANRVGRSVVKDTLGGCVVYSAQGEILARANMEGREEILYHNLDLAAI